MAYDQDILTRLKQRGSVNPIRKAIGSAMVTLGTGKPPEVPDDYNELFLKEAIKNEFEDPTVRQLREAEISALNQPPPPGFIRHGKQLLPDPNHINPNEQVAIDREQRQYDKDMAEQKAAAQAKESNDNLIKMQAQDVYDTATNIEKGANFFGPIGGDFPTWAAPSSWLPGGKTPGQRTDWEANLDKLRAGLTLDRVNAMRSAGTTGSTGMGVLSNTDIQLLTNASTALRRNLEPKDAMRYIKQIKDIQAKFLGLSDRGDGNSTNTDLDSKVNSMLDQLGA